VSSRGPIKADRDTNVNTTTTVDLSQVFTPILSLRNGFTAYAVLPGDEFVLSPSSAD
jgi:hypothetical protein